MSYITTDGELNFAKIIKHAVIGIIVLIILFGTFGVVSAGQIGVRTRLGKVVGTVANGPYMKLPIIDQVHKMDVKTRTINYDKNAANAKEGDALDTAQLFGASSDLQDVKIGVVVTYHVDPTKAMQIYWCLDNLRRRQKKGSTSSTNARLTLLTKFLS